MSWPHFLHGDPVLRQSLEGVEAPARERDEFYFDIEPIWGTTLSAHAAFQFNVLVNRNGYHGFDNIQQKVMLPFLMLEEGVQGPNEVLLAMWEVIFFAKLSPNFSFSWAELSLFLRSPTNPPYYMILPDTAGYSRILPDTAGYCPILGFSWFFMVFLGFL